MVSPINPSANLVSFIQSIKKTLPPDQVAESYVNEFFALADTATTELVPYLTPESYTTNPGMAYFESLGNLSSILQSYSSAQLGSTPGFIKEMGEAIIAFNNNIKFALQQLRTTGVVDYSAPPLGVGPDNLGGSSGETIQAMNDVIALFQ